MMGLTLCEETCTFKLKTGHPSYSPIVVLAWQRSETMPGQTGRGCTNISFWGEVVHRAVEDALLGDVVSRA